MNKRLQRVLMVLCTILFISLPVSIFGHLGIGIVFVLFALGSMVLVTIAVLVNHGKAVIDINSKEIHLSSDFFGYQVKQPKTIRYDGLVFHKFRHRGKRRYSIHCDTIENEAFISGLHRDQVERIKTFIETTAS